jgi:hypothetical protein
MLGGTIPEKKKYVERTERKISRSTLGMKKKKGQWDPVTIILQLL